MGLPGLVAEVAVERGASQPSRGRLTPDVPELLALLSATFADPARTTLPALGQIDAAVAGLTEQTDPIWVARVGLACMLSTG